MPLKNDNRVKITLTDKQSEALKRIQEKRGNCSKASLLREAIDKFIKANQ